MDLSRKIAGLIMTAYSDRAWDDRNAQRERVLREVVETGVGGYCIFGGEIERTRALNEEVVGASGRSLLIASDLERGLGQQLDGGTVFPSQMALGATGSHELVRAVGWATAREARSVGINLVFAPVADVMTEPNNPIIGVRAFGGDAPDVAALTEAFVRGCQSGGAAATVKHFPGHGDTTIDSHVGLPFVSVDRATLGARELVPFRAAVDAGVRAVMTGHIAFPRLTGDNTAATLSPGIVQGILRSDLGFEGVIVTDALLMVAIAGLHEPGEAAVLALEAGADVLLMPADVEAAVAGVAGAVGSGRLPEERIDRSLERVADLLAWLETAGAPAAPGAGEPDLSGDALARAVAVRAITLLSNDGLLPLDAPTTLPDDVTAIACVDEERPPDLSALRGRLAEILPGAELLVVDGGIAPEAVRKIASVPRRGLSILFVFDEPAAWRGRPGPSAPLIDAARRIIESHARSVVVGFAAPRVASLLPGAGAFLCCYDGSAHTQMAALDVLFGNEPARGRLPLAVPGLFPRGHGHTRG